MLLRCARATLAAVLVVASLMLLADSSAAAPALRLSRSSVITGETVTVSGSVGGKVARTVVLQRRTRSTWVRIVSGRTTRTGAFSFSYRPPTSTKAGIVVRVVAPAAKSGSRRLRLVVTGSRSVVSQVATARIQAPSSVSSSAPLTVTGSFSPARAGRATEVQRLDHGTWTPVATGTQDRSGSTTFTIGLAEAGTQALRVRALPAAGAPQAMSAQRTITVTAPGGPTNPESPVDDGPLTAPTGVSAVAADGEAYITWDPSSAGDLDGYRVYSAATADGPWTDVSGLLGPRHEATFTAGGLTNGTGYVFAVTQTRADVESSKSVTELVTPQGEVTADPPTDPPTDQPTDAPTDIPTDPPTEEPPSPPVPPEDCGDVVLKPDGSPWTCTMGEDFTGTTYDRTRWVPQQMYASGTPSAFACYRNTPETIAVGQGVLSLSLVHVSEPVSCAFGKLSGPTDIVGGSLMTYQRFVQQYGRIEARIKTQATTLPGLQEAFWLWPDDRVPSEDKWPTAGEIDVSETYSYQPHLSIPFLHYRADSGGAVHGLNTAWNCTAERGVWNTYTLLWSADRLEIQVNGTTCLVNTSGDSAFNKPYFLTFSALLGAEGNVYDGKIPLPATMQVDYVRAWK